MAKKIVTKFERRKKRERGERRAADSQRRKGRIFIIMSGNSIRPKVTDFDEDEMLLYFAKRNAIGFAYCPFCKSKKILVENKSGQQGEPDYDYFMNHSNKKKILCEGSQKMIKVL